MVGVRQGLRDTHQKSRGEEEIKEEIEGAFDQKPKERLCSVDQGICRGEVGVMDEPSLFHLHGRAA